MSLSLFLELGPALQKLFEIGRELRDEDFVEFDDSQYEDLEDFGEDTDRKWYNIRGMDAVADEADRAAFLDAVAYVHRVAADEAEPPADFEAELFAAARKLPPLFSRGTRFFRGRLTVIEGGVSSDEEPPPRSS